MRSESRADRSMLLAGLHVADGRQQHEEQACDGRALTGAAARHGAGVGGPKPALCNGRGIYDGRAYRSAASHPHLAVVSSTGLGHDQYTTDCRSA